MIPPGGSPHAAVEASSSEADDASAKASPASAAAAGVAPGHPSSQSWDITVSEDDNAFASALNEGRQLQQQLSEQLHQLAALSGRLSRRLQRLRNATLQQEGLQLPEMDYHADVAQALEDAQAALHAPARGPMTKVSLAEAPSYQLPNQENKLALVMDPFTDKVPFTFGVEVFPPGHRTPPHVHNTAHEMFFIVSGAGEAFCDGRRFRVTAGDTVVFPPGSTHGIDADEGSKKLYCLELMLPNEQFAEMVRAGQQMEGLGQDDMCILAAIGCH